MFPNREAVRLVTHVLTRVQRKRIIPINPSKPSRPRSRNLVTASTRPTSLSLSVRLSTTPAPRNDDSREIRLASQPSLLHCSSDSASNARMRPDQDGPLSRCTKAGPSLSPSSLVMTNSSQPRSVHFFPLSVSLAVLIQSSLLDPTLAHLCRSRVPRVFRRRTRLGLARRSAFGTFVPLSVVPRDRSRIGPLAVPDGTPVDSRRFVDLSKARRTAAEHS